MRVLVGDIHGCTRKFDAILSAVDFQFSDTLLTCTGYVDCGPRQHPITCGVGR